MELAADVMVDPALARGLIGACHRAIAANVDHLSALDRAIGDGDHGTNMMRGLDALAAAADELSGMAPGEALSKAGMALVMSIGGAAGPLYGTLLIEMGKGLGADVPGGLAAAFGKAVDAVARRGRSGPGDKTLLDVLYPLHAEMLRAAPLDALAETAKTAAQATQFMEARRGRAAWLGARSIGHVDPGAASAALLAAAICNLLVEYRSR